MAPQGNNKSNHPGKNLEVFVLGTGGTMPIPGRALASVLVRREGEMFLFDCGESVQLALRAMNLRWKSLAGIFISHIHADHVTGLPGILMLSSQADRIEPLYVYGPPGIENFMLTMRRTLPMYIDYEIIVKEVEGHSHLLSGKSYDISAFPLRHTKQCLAYCIEERARPGLFFPEKAATLGVPRGHMWSILQSGRPATLPCGKKAYPDEVMGKKRQGRKFSFVADTTTVAGLSHFVRDSDLLICEGMYTADLVDLAHRKKHLTASEAATIARDGNVDSLGLIHYSHEYHEGDLLKLLNEALEVFPHTFLTKDLQRIGLPNHE